MPYNFADPSLIKVGRMWYAFSTASNGTNIQIARSRNFQDWDLVFDADNTARDALPAPPTWVNTTMPNTWAPDVQQVDDGTFVMYYSATTAIDNTVSPMQHFLSSSLGELTDLSETLHRCCHLARHPRTLPASSRPNVLPSRAGGAIDADGFKDWLVKGGGWEATTAGAGTESRTSRTTAGATGDGATAAEVDRDT